MVPLSPDLDDLLYYNINLVAKNSLLRQTY